MTTMTEGQVMPEERTPECEDAAARRSRSADPTRRQVLDLVRELPFEDDPSTFARVLAELADRHALDGKS